VSNSPEYRKVLAELNDAGVALIRAEGALDLIRPDDVQLSALDDLVVAIQASAELIGRRTGANERVRTAQAEPAEAGSGRPAPDPVAAMPEAEATGADPATQLPRPLSPMEGARRLRLAETALACVCSPTDCTRADSRGCIVCANLDPGQPCYAPSVAKWNTGNEAAASDARVPLESEGLRQARAYLDQALYRMDDPEPEDGQ
jgi:hypothetical protein